jgi:hypothetical protein
MRCDNENILKAAALSRELLDLSEKGDMERTDGSCGVLYGIIRDAAFKIQDCAEKEKRKHLLKGTWD